MSQLCLYHTLSPGERSPAGRALCLYHTLSPGERSPAGRARLERSPWKPCWGLSHQNVLTTASFQSSQFPSQGNFPSSKGRGKPSGYYGGRAYRCNRCRLHRCFDCRPRRGKHLWHRLRRLSLRVTSWPPLFL